ncbi:MAG: hypothetical protein K8823_1189 [Cenarchaeum symbiont of Oopsacas minuta]|nr:hypothetical protein [Cenarchaeum symbiont of Oopsacas minuta]
MVSIKENDGNMIQFDINDIDKKHKTNISPSLASQCELSSHTQYPDTKFDSIYHTDLIPLKELLDDFLEKLHGEIKLSMLTQQTYKQSLEPSNVKFKRSDAPTTYEDNDDMLDLIHDKKKIEETIIKNTIPDEDFYPHEIAFKFNLDLKTTMQVVRKLIEDGVISE